MDELSKRLIEEVFDPKENYIVEVPSINALTTGADNHDVSGTILREDWYYTQAITDAVNTRPLDEPDILFEVGKAAETQAALEAIKVDLSIEAVKIHTLSLILKQFREVVRISSRACLFLIQVLAKVSI